MADADHCAKHKRFKEGCMSCGVAFYLAMFKRDNAKPLSSHEGLAGIFNAINDDVEREHAKDGAFYSGAEWPSWAAGSFHRAQAQKALNELYSARAVEERESHVNCAHGVPLDLSCGACKAGEIANPKDAVGSLKLSFSKVPKRALAEVALAFMDGAKKYGAMNWRSAPVRLTVYTDAISRHVAALEDGQDCAADGARLHHLAYIAAGAMVALDAYLNGRLDDDRPVGATDPNYMTELNERAAKLLAG